jgi:multiple sugar transport system ATP-binding protein
MSENLGSDTFVHIQDSGLADILTVRMEGDQNYHRGDKIFMSPKAEHLHLFNEQGERL